MLLPLLLLATPADTVRYVVDFPNAVHHEAHVSVTFPARGRDTLEVWLSRSSPGRYALHEFAKNVYSVAATDAHGKALTVVQRDPYRWVVGARGGAVTFTYTLFADRADGTYAAIDLTHAHLNMPATFAFARGREALPISVRFVVPAGVSWTAATQLTPTRDPLTFTAPDLQYFMDSPTELADFAVRTWLVKAGKGGMDTMRLAVHHTGTDADLDAYAELAKRVVAQEIGIFGEPAPYDHHTYTFLADYVAWGAGDGMEHRNSTVISAPIMLHDNALGALGTLAHEYFHSWNMERIRSKQIEPFDFTRANPSDALWFGEGFTSYFDQLSIRRAGITTDSAYAGIVGGLVNAVVNAPGRRFFNALDMSRQAPFVDAATAIDPNNRSNTFLSYYTLGAGIGLGLDLTIRTRFPGKSLDGFMRQMWVGYGRNERPYIVKRPYTVDDLERELGVYTGDMTFARDFFAKYIRGHEVVDYATLLSGAGFTLRPAHPGVATLGTGAVFAFDTAGAEVRRSTLIGSPLYSAGIDRGDRVRSLDGVPLTSADALRSAMAGKKVGDTVALVIDQRGARRSVTATLTADVQLEAVPVETTGTAATPAQLQFRSSWLGSTVR